MPRNQTLDFKSERIQTLLLEMGQQRSTPALFNLIVNRLNTFKEISLARIWLIKNGDVCTSCLLANECRDQLKCLHLVASAGCSTVHPEEDWSRINGSHSRFPLGARKVGFIADTGKPVIVKSIKEDSFWIVHQDWAEKEGIKGFAGHPICYRGKVLGVLAVFSKKFIDQQVLDILNIITNHAASALVNAESFEKIKDLTQKLKIENTYLREELFDNTPYSGFIGQSSCLKRVIEQIALVASTNTNVLILGESGTGKELVAHEVHRRSPRSDKPMIKVNCASIPRDLFSSEFFGHVKGAFTGALNNRQGKFSAAQKGTLFMDEVGEIPLEQQAHLLRVLQEKEYERVGEEKTRKTDVRIIAATNKNLKEEVDKGIFREDLYFRLNVFPIEVPPLRERKEDIELLANYFLQKSLANMKRQPFKFSPEQIAELKKHSWPGNVRELQNIVERFAIESSSSSTPSEISFFSKKDPLHIGTQKNILNIHDIMTEDEMLELQIKNIKNALNLCKGKIYGKDGAAQLLRVKPTTLATRIKRFKINNPK